MSSCNALWCVVALTLAPYTTSCSAPCTSILMSDTPVKLYESNVADRTVSPPLPRLMPPAGHITTQHTHTWLLFVCMLTVQQGSRCTACMGSNSHTHHPHVFVDVWVLKQGVYTIAAHMHFQTGV